jgi:signal transduction histidine kinase
LNSLVTEKTETLKTTNEELIKHNNELIQFSYTVSHNLRGPVARLLGLTQLLNNEKDPSLKEAMIEMIHKSGNELDTVIKDLNKVIDIRNELYKSKEIVDLETEWNICYGFLKENIKDAHDISCDFEQAPALYGIKAYIQSILFNLLSNAIKYKSSNKILRVKALSWIDQGQIVIEIRDNGIGFDAAKYYDQVFKLFKRFHPHIEGRGIGLYLVKMQVEAMSGSIQVQSAIDEGTTFTLTYPIAFNTHKQMDNNYAHLDQ